MLKTIVVAARDRERLAEITSVATRYGLDLLLSRMGLAKGDDGAPPPDLPRRTRQALEALGPTYVKLGQILATRADLLPPEWIAEFESLHSAAPTLPFDTLQPALEEALGEKVDTAFASFDPQPLAAASMAQVHRATLHDGREVVVKIRRPGIRRAMEADLRLITHLAGIVEASSKEARRFQPRALVQQLLDTLLEELDFTHEGRNADRLRCRLLVEGANGPTDLEADSILSDRGILVVPDIVANAGGVTVSYFEWVQGSQQFFWSEQEVNNRLIQLMQRAFREVHAVSERRRVTLRTAALMRGIERIAEAKRVRGVFP